MRARTCRMPHALSTATYYALCAVNAAVAAFFAPHMVVRYGRNVSWLPRLVGGLHSAPRATSSHSQYGVSEFVALHMEHKVVGVGVFAASRLAGVGERAAGGGNLEKDVSGLNIMCIFSGCLSMGNIQYVHEPNSKNEVISKRANEEANG
ncbi:unnamed protein product [Ceratitis capitata]|uniref:(Mediterranean fruit fly) hypothetical protein n=1 Tax=Ceratitis capitata TaxID=7213 RepID=A0A811UMP6_CERCA|nr:unnamed protein product [Ceratitis capitata]